MRENTHSVRIIQIIKYNKIMKLITKKIEEKLAAYPLYSQEGRNDDAVIICKFFTPDADWTWFVLEGERRGDDYEFYGIVKNSFGTEYGYFLMSDLMQVRGHLGLPVERDMYFDAKKVRDIIND